ncbi:uncharacterized protein LOC134694913 isoform X2 [Mytilus trossulus]|uniref:uncharacterized protein LOC134694913 isoform X2 n=1 Tax=Mytilus trossulus TaxID=6551 RepID=UPI0030071DE5
MTLNWFLESVLVVAMLLFFNDVIKASFYEPLTNNDDTVWRILTSRYKRSEKIKTDVNVTSSEKQTDYNVSSTKGTKCFNESITSTNGTFYCPDSGHPSKWTACCGDKPQQYCCLPDIRKNQKKQDVTLDLITALSIVIGFIVSISCCLLLYCCCCQKRSGVHSGKLVWIKRKKQGSKTVYTTSDNPDLDDDEQEGTELVGFIEQKDEEGFRSRTGSVAESRPGSRRASKASIDHKHEHNHEHKHKHDHKHEHKHDHNKTDTDAAANHSPVPVVKHVTPSGQVLMVPLINIQGSTPGTSPS